MATETDAAASSPPAEAPAPVAPESSAPAEAEALAPAAPEAPEPAATAPAPVAAEAPAPEAPDAPAPTASEAAAPAAAPASAEDAHAHVAEPVPDPGRTASEAHPAAAHETHPPAEADHSTKSVEEHPLQAVPAESVTLTAPQEAAHKEETAPDSPAAPQPPSPVVHETPAAEETTAAPSVQMAADTSVSAAPEVQPDQLQPPVAPPAAATILEPLQATPQPPAEPEQKPIAAKEEDGPGQLLKELEQVMGASASKSSKPPKQQAESFTDDFLAEDSRDSGKARSLRGKDPLSASMPNFGDYKDLKKKTEFAGLPTDGVLKRQTFMSSISSFRSGPKYSMASRGPCSFIKLSTTPAPGSYNTPIDERSKFKSPPKFSFGGCSRFGTGDGITRKQPGPGQYNPRDPRDTSVKVSFAGNTHNRGPQMPEANPGPGAYEAKTTIGQGKMFTAGGRHPVHYMSATSLPGPGAYSPSTQTIFGNAPKCGFGTSIRSDIAGNASKLVAMPGPGTYDMQNALTVGSTGPKYSATSRRRVHDLDSYVTPGPGSYNSHMTSFGS